MFNHSWHKTLNFDMVFVRDDFTKIIKVPQAKNSQKKRILTMKLMNRKAQTMRK